MGIEQIKNNKGQQSLIFDKEDFVENDLLGDKIEDYTFLRIDNTGKYSYEAKVQSLTNNKIYTLKQLNLFQMSEDQIDCIEDEINILKKMDHPYVTKFYTHFKPSKDKIYLVTEYVGEGNLSSYINLYKNLKKPIPEQKVIELFLKCSEALKYIHNNNIIHRDIKSNTIYITDDNKIKIGGFSVSTIANIERITKIMDTKHNLENQHQTYAGTPLYMCPEIIHGENYGKKADIYSLGVVFYEVCFYQYPFRPIIVGKDEDNDPILDLLPVKKTNNINFYSEFLENIISKMLEKDSEKRPSADEVYDLLKKEYIKKYIDNSGVISVVKCLYAFNNLNQAIKNCNKDNNKQFTNFYSNCIDNINNFDNLKEILFNIRNYYLTDKISLSNFEIPPNIVYNIIIDKLNRENNLNNTSSVSFSIQQQNNSNPDKTVSFNNFISYKNNYFNSFISDLFSGILKTKRICVDCRFGFYFFELLSYIEFNYDACISLDSKIENWFFRQRELNTTLSTDHNVICQRCNKSTNHFEFKQLYSLSKNLVISIKRGPTKNIEKNIEYPEKLQISQSIENNDAPNSYDLIGIIKKVNINSKDTYIYLYLEPVNKKWKVCEGNNIKDIENPLKHCYGEVVMLFYTSENN